MGRTVIVAGRINLTFVNELKGKSFMGSHRSRAKVMDGGERAAQYPAKGKACARSIPERLSQSACIPIPMWVVFFGAVLICILLGFSLLGFCRVIFSTEFPNSWSLNISKATELPLESKTYFSPCPT